MQSPNAIDIYIEKASPQVQPYLRQLHAVIRAAAPEAEEAIRYGVPTFLFHGNLVHFGGYKNHVSLYPTSLGVAQFERELAAYKTSKGTIQFPLDKPLPTQLITAIVHFLVEQKNKEPSVRKKRKGVVNAIEFK